MRVPSLTFSVVMVLASPTCAAEKSTGTKEVQLTHSDPGNLKAKTVVIADNAAMWFVEDGRSVKTTPIRTQERSAMENVRVNGLVSGVRAVLPKGWKCTVITESGKMGHPHGLEEPAFRIDFVNPTEVFEDQLLRKRLHPTLRLHFYRIGDKRHILEKIEAEKIYSCDIPIYFSETAEYLVVTSPSWINEGCFTKTATKLMAPLEQALKEHFLSQK
jgi:hypothetical protein